MAHLFLGCVFMRSILQEVMSEARALVCLPRHSEDLSTPLAVRAGQLQGHVKAVCSLLLSPFDGSGSFVVLAFFRVLLCSLGRRYSY